MLYIVKCCETRLFVPHQYRENPGKNDYNRVPDYIYWEGDIEQPSWNFKYAYFNITPGSHVGHTSRSGPNRYSPKWVQGYSKKSLEVMKHYMPQCVWYRSIYHNMSRLCFVISAPTFTHLYYAYSITSADKTLLLVEYT